eukprot:3343221-Amphidinium_carterae.1
MGKERKKKEAPACIVGHYFRLFCFSSLLAGKEWEGERREGEWEGERRQGGTNKQLARTISSCLAFIPCLQASTASGSGARSAQASIV